MPEKVFLTVGRHGHYNYGARLPLSESSILEGVYRGQKLTAAYGQFDAIYSSDIPRAKATANLRAIGGNYDRNKIIYSFELRENSTLGNVSLFLDVLAAEASLNGFRHVHLVTHAPVIEKIFSLFNPAICFVPPDGGFTGEMENWEDLSRRKMNFTVWPDYYPEFSLLSDLWKKSFDIEAVRQYFEKHKKSNLDWDKVGFLLNKSRCVNQGATIEDIYCLLG